MADTTFQSGTLITKEWLQDVNDAVYGTDGVVQASAVVVVPAGGISSTNVQAALEELDTEKSSTSHDHSGVYEPVITTLAVNKGGTGQTTSSAAAQALLDAVGTTQGDILYNNGTDWVVLAKGTALQQLRMNSGATAPEWATKTLGLVSSSEIAVPAANTIASFAHGLGTIPAFFTVHLKCIDAGGDIGYVQNDTVQLATEEWYTGGLDTYRVVFADATNVNFRWYGDGIYLCRGSGTSSGAAITTSKWRLIFRAAL